jgi:hypothetical protein
MKESSLGMFGNLNTVTFFEKNEDLDLDVLKKEAVLKFNPTKIDDYQLWRAVDSTEIISTVCFAFFEKRLYSLGYEPILASSLDWEELS